MHTSERKLFVVLAKDETVQPPAVKVGHAVVKTEAVEEDDPTLLSSDIFCRPSSRFVGGTIGQERMRGFIDFSTALSVSVEPVEGASMDLAADTRVRGLRDPQDGIRREFDTSLLEVGDVVKVRDSGFVELLIPAPEFSATATSVLPAPE